MPYPLESKLVVAVSSGALFDLTESHEVFEREGEDAYRAYMRDLVDTPLAPGKAFLFIKRFLSLNDGFSAGEGPVEVIILSRNDPEAGSRIFASARAHGLGIVRAAFLDGSSPYPYAAAFDASLFLSANQADVEEAVGAGLPAGLVLSPGFDEKDDASNPLELRVAFDFDGVLADDEAEQVYRSQGGLSAFLESEERKSDRPLDPGPMKGFLEKLATLQVHIKADPSWKGTRIRTAIVTARNAPAHERVVSTLRGWGIFADEIFFLGGIEKRRVLEVLRPHLFFDDQRSHFEGAGHTAVCVHVPFGIANR